jgi:hypothetical protein
MNNPSIGLYVHVRRRSRLVDCDDVQPFLLCTTKAVKIRLCLKGRIKRLKSDFYFYFYSHRQQEPVISYSDRYGVRTSKSGKTLNGCGS